MDGYDFPHGGFIELAKPLYGLADQPARWENKLQEALKSVGGTRLRSEPAVYAFYKGKGGQDDLKIIRLMQHHEREAESKWLELSPLPKEIPNYELIGLLATFVDDVL